MNLMTDSMLHKLRDWIANDDVIKFYHTNEWRKVRAKRLKLDHYECQVCKAQGKHTHATTVHHIKHVRDYPMQALNLNNTETICRVHHNTEHPEKLEQFHKDKFENEERW